MKKNCLILASAAIALVLVALPAAGQQGPLLAKVNNEGIALVWSPVVEFNELILTVTGPCAFEYRQVVRPGDQPIFKLDERTIDGYYTYNLSRNEKVDGSIVEFLQRARRENDLEAPKKLCREGLLPGPPDVQAESFLVNDGKIVWDPEEEERRPGQLDFDELLAVTQAAAGPSSTVSQAQGNLNGVPTKDFVINDDLIVDGSACIGFDCVNGESFSFDTIRLKENNLRIKFDDTSVAASFPRTDWQLTANASANGGASKFSIDDISGNRTPFTVEANARSHSLYVDDGGRIGNRTSTPSTEIHTIDGDTPTLRLQQDGSSGFAPQTWDVAGNETNFFIRDVSNGSQLPFRIRPSAPTDSLFVDTDGSVGIGTASPDAKFEVQSSSGSAVARVEEESGTEAIRDLLVLRNNGTTRISFTDTSGNGSTWANAAAGPNFTISRNGTGGAELTLTDTGDMTILGTLTENSDRNVKTDIEAVDPAAVLARLAAMPIAEWRYKDNPENVRHIGPMAQDFFAAFGLNGTETGISTLDTSGVALAAIQGLNAELESKDEEIDDLKARLAALEALVSKLATDAP